MKTNRPEIEMSLKPFNCLLEKKPALTLMCTATYVLKRKRLYLLLLFMFCFIHFGMSQSEIISEEILISNDSIQLPGTLTFHTGETKQPLVIFVHGSGNVDRNGNQAGAPSSANYIKQLSDSLVSKNIAFYRYDKRSATASNVPFMMKDMRFYAFTEDVNLAIAHFMDDTRFSSITLIGHSQGSLVAMLANHEHVDKYISIAGPSTSIDKALIEQVRARNGDSLANLVVSHFKELQDTGSIAKVDPNLMVLFNKPTQPFMASWMAYDPSEELKKLEMPILILNGDKDLQVAVVDAETLHKAQPNSKLVIIKDMNHVLKTIVDDYDNFISYTKPDFPLSSALVDAIAAFIKK
ncbi:alpha/beta hydrolase [Subsaximicrobium wynnwilliamsii]|nr:alpha/beta hydrolase [Subsaximicrobium wynnwilliamsii]